ncbi:polysaccharide pyruvyl transferase family protein [Paenibacillus polysaccharolyticus]|uniref:polysaccharide pyruvyl transferase family protein n=1 Tax=Paenibacillus polysaccharolyticus TaxID=582692 RepID=UPI00203E3014|nr:polysaccharide pyruvyl transferase family protein [Paenibacillus polysaccharolyticus]MCM3135341.1 polysaccharide pyruvyl transferase family protein [Paenibacillus polysaccharolyticus]
MLDANNIHPMEELKGHLRQILKVIPSGSNIYYLDYPVHSNGGDLLIMKGTEAFFRDNEINVLARYSVLDCPLSLNVPDGITIVLHGGGNFGDLYPAHQKLRERMINQHPHHRIVILPQTMFYKSDIELKKTAQVFNRHKDVHFFVRDTVSYEIAKREFRQTNVYLSPDMAHQLWPLKSKGQPLAEMLYFFRKDIEKTKNQTHYESISGPEAVFKDWETLYNRIDRKIIRMITSRLKSSKGRSLARWLWYKYSDRMVHTAIKEFSKYKTVTTSRLHGHILACLLDQPNVLLDNSYGKNSNYYAAWTKNNPVGRLEANQSGGAGKSGTPGRAEAANLAKEPSKGSGAIVLSDGAAL